MVDSIAWTINNAKKIMAEFVKKMYVYDISIELEKRIKKPIRTKTMNELTYERVEIVLTHREQVKKRLFIG